MSFSGLGKFFDLKLVPGLVRMTVANSRRGMNKSRFLYEIYPTPPQKKYPEALLSSNRKLSFVLIKSSIEYILRMTIMSVSWSVDVNR